MGKITSYRILIKCKRNKRILIWCHICRWLSKNSYTKKTTKLLPFSILRHNLSKFLTQMGIYDTKQLETTFSSSLWKTVAYHLWRCCCKVWVLDLTSQWEYVVPREWFWSVCVWRCVPVWWRWCLSILLTPAMSSATCRWRTNTLP